MSSIVTIQSNTDSTRTKGLKESFDVKCEIFWDLEETVFLYCIFHWSGRLAPYHSWTCQWTTAAPKPEYTVKTRVSGHQAGWSVLTKMPQDTRWHLTGSKTLFICIWKLFYGRKTHMTFIVLQIYLQQILWPYYGYIMASEIIYFII